jgi:hypothetical protein
MKGFVLFAIFFVAISTSTTILTCRANSSQGNITVTACSSTLGFSGFCQAAFGADCAQSMKGWASNQTKVQAIDGGMYGPTLIYTNFEDLNE